MDHSLEDLFEIMRIVSDSKLSCGSHSENASKWCDHYDTCNECRAALIDAIERKIADEYVRLLKDADSKHVTDELPEMLRKAAKGGYEGSKGKVIDNIAQLIGYDGNIDFAVIDALADKVEQALSETYAKGHLDGFDEAEQWHTEQGDWLGENTHTPPSDGERITDELRKWFVRKLPVMDSELHKDFTTIADRIDAEHERLMQEQPFTIDMVPMTDELKPCPFCGGKAEFRSGSSTTPYIRCKECGGRTKSSHNRVNLIAVWNRKTQ